MQKLIPFFILLTSFLYRTEAFPYQMTVILNISQSKKTFVTRLGRAHGISKNSEATFSTPYLSLAAKAIEVSRNMSLWQIIEPSGLIPFLRNQIVTFNFGLEKIWMMDPEEYMFTEEKWALKQAQENKLSHPMALSLRASFAKGLAQSISSALSPEINFRDSSQVEVLISHRFFHHISLSYGAKYEYEITDSSSLIVQAVRTYVIGDFRYDFYPFRLYSRPWFPYAGFTLGMGRSTTTITKNAKISGSAYVLPSFRLGLEYIYNGRYGFLFECGAEYITTSESFKDGFRQSSNLFNAKIGTGIKKYF